MTAEPTYLYLTTTGRRSGRPRRIEIWFTRHEGHHYLVAEHGLKAQWVQNLLANRTVRVRVGAARFRGSARVVDHRREPELVSEIRRLSEAKYGWGAGLVVEIRRTRPAAKARS